MIEFLIAIMIKKHMEKSKKHHGSMVKSTYAILRGLENSVLRDLMSSSDLQEHSDRLVCTPMCRYVHVHMYMRTHTLSHSHTPHTLFKMKKLG